MNLPDISGLVDSFRSLALSIATVVAGPIPAATGLAFLFQAGLLIYQGARSNREEISWGKVAGAVAVGVLLIQFARTMDNTTQLLSGHNVDTNYSSALAYIPLANKSSFWKGVLDAIFAWIVAMGWIGGFRGLLLWKQASNGKSSRGDEFWRGCTHLLGAAAAVNIGYWMPRIFQ